MPNQIEGFHAPDDLQAVMFGSIRVYLTFAPFT